MNILTHKPYLIFFLSIPLILLSSLLSTKDVLDINIHDTYYVFTLSHLNIVISLLFTIIGLGYWIMVKANKRLSKLLNAIHILLTFGSILLIWILANLFRESIIDYKFHYNLNLTIYLIALIAIIAQLIFPINIIYGLVKKNKTST